MFNAIMGPQCSNIPTFEILTLSYIPLSHAKFQSNLSKVNLDFGAFRIGDLEVLNLICKQGTH